MPGAPWRINYRRKNVVQSDQLGGNQSSPAEKNLSERGWWDIFVVACFKTGS
jgi:hypothetical protein